ncbi:hypothetical protein ACEU59_07525 [Buttiauxella noackiae]|uniref:hypothetical protein n=1 Tax=Buttiauxella noackiae TaxID=82992 RepID=UPI0035A5E49A
MEFIRNRVLIIMTLPAKLPLKGSQIKAETGLASMKAAGAALGLGAGFKMSQLVGRTYGNFNFTPVAVLAPSIYGVGSGKGTVNRNAVGGQFTGFAALLCTIGTTANSQVALQLNNKNQASYTMFVKNNGKTYTFTKASAANTYAISTPAAAYEFGNMVKANVGKLIVTIVTPH